MAKAKHQNGLRTIAGDADDGAVGCALPLHLDPSALSVVDGDTVDVRLDDGAVERLRLIGIDTPEVVDPRTPQQSFGRELQRMPTSCWMARQFRSRRMWARATTTCRSRCLRSFAAAAQRSMGRRRGNSLALRLYLRIAGHSGRLSDNG
jgi:hypothetical protein